MSSLEVIGIVASCVQAFQSGAELVDRYRSQREQDAELERVLQDMLQEAMDDGRSQLSEQFLQEQKALGQHSYLLREGDNTAKEELLVIAITLQADIINKLGHALIEPAKLKSLQKTAIEQRVRAISSIVELRKRVQKSLASTSQSGASLSHKTSNKSMARSFVADAVRFSSQSGTTLAGSSERRGSSVVARPALKTLATNDQLIPVIHADDIDSLTLHEADEEESDGRSAYAPELAVHSPDRQPISPCSSAARPPEPVNFNYPGFSSAASVRAADAPEPLSAAAEVMPLEAVGPYFPPRTGSNSSNALTDRTPPPTPFWRRHERPSLPEPPTNRPENMPWATRVFSTFSAPSPSTSPRISEPDSLGSLRSTTTKPYCNGAIAAQEEFQLGFTRHFLPVMPNSEKKDLCWKCKECDYNASDSDKQLFDRIEFRFGVRFRFTYLARSHVPYSQSPGTFKSKYHYGCLFCTAEGKKSIVHDTVDLLMSHIKDKHRTNLTPAVRERTRCVVGRLASREDDWDCNLPDVSIRKHSGNVGKWMLHAVTSLPT